MSIGPHLLGRVQEHDPASRNYVHPYRLVAATELQPVTHTLAMPHLDQRDIGSCEGNTAMEFLGCAKAIANRRAFWKAQGRHTNTYPTEKEAVDCYTLATQIDAVPGAYPEQDTGTSGLGVAKALQKSGAIKDYDWTFDWGGFMSTLQTRPVMLGTVWYGSMFTHDNTGLVKVSGKAAGGHAYLAFAYRPGNPGHSGCTNHWVRDDGSPWGVRIGKHDGCFWIADFDLRRLLINEGGESLVPVLM